MYARILSVLALGLLIFVGGQHTLLAQIGIAPSNPDQQRPPQQQQQQHPCQSEFNALREELQAKGKSLQDAGKRKASAKELCGRIIGYQNSENKMLGFFAKKGSECGIPAEAAAGLKKSQARTAELRTKVCQAANNPGPAPAAPNAGLSGALGPSSGVVQETPLGGGIFDTLSGNVLQQ
jgi:Skp family chaperone for outer membrane proteins